VFHIWVLEAFHHHVGVEVVGKPARSESSDDIESVLACVVGVVVLGKDVLEVLGKTATEDILGLLITPLRAMRGSVV
jgi:hypothetical protein